MEDGILVRKGGWFAARHRETKGILEGGNVAGRSLWVRQRANLGMS